MAKVTEKLGGMLARMRGKNSTAVQLSRRERDEQLVKFTQSVGDVSDTMKAVRQYLDDQADRSDEMMDMMRGLPEVLASIPEANRTQTQLVKAIAAQLEAANTNSAHLTEALQSLGKASGKQDETLGQIRDHLTEESETKRDLQTGIAAMTSTLESVEVSNLAAERAMTDAQEQQRRSEERMMELYRKSQRTTGIMLLIAAFAVAGALAFVAYLVLTR